MGALAVAQTTLHAALSQSCKHAHKVLAAETASRGRENMQVNEWHAYTVPARKLLVWILAEAEIGQVIDVMPAEHAHQVLAARTPLRCRCEMTSQWQAVFICSLWKLGKRLRLSRCICSSTSSMHITSQQKSQLPGIEMECRPCRQRAVVQAQVLIVGAVAKAGTLQIIAPMPTEHAHHV